MEGRALFLKALDFQFALNYKEATLAFIASAALGNGDACWHLYQNYEYGGYCQRVVSGAFDHVDYLRQGAKVGHVMCVARLAALQDERDMDAIRDLSTAFALPLTPQAEVVVYTAWPDYRYRRFFSAGEVSAMKKAAQDALIIHNPCPVASYFEYQSEFAENTREAVQSIEPRMLGQGLYLLEITDIFRFRYETKEESYISRFRDFDEYYVLDKNEFCLSRRTIRIARCVIGQLRIRSPNPVYCDEEEEEDDGGDLVPEEEEEEVDKYAQDGCVRMYRQYQAMGRNAALAWMVCYRRRVLTHLTRDTATLIGKMLMDAVLWAERF